MTVKETVTSKEKFNMLRRYQNADHIPIDCGRSTDGKTKLAHAVITEKSITS